MAYVHHRVTHTAISSRHRVINYRCSVIFVTEHRTFDIRVWKVKINLVAIWLISQLAMTVFIHPMGATFVNVMCGKFDLKYSSYSCINCRRLLYFAITNMLLAASVYSCHTFMTIRIVYILRRHCFLVLIVCMCYISANLCTFVSVDLNLWLTVYIAVVVLPPGDVKWITSNQIVEWVFKHVEYS